LPEEIAGFPDLRPFRALDREEFLPHLDDLGVDLVRLLARRKVRLVFLVAVRDERSDLTGQADRLLVDGAGLPTHGDGHSGVLLVGLHAVRVATLEASDSRRASS